MNYVKIKSIKKVKTEPIYHMTVSQNHNFFANNLCVHNCDYRGEIKVILYNSTSVPYLIKKGDRIAQLVFAAILKPEGAIFDDFDEFQNESITSRGQNGFGHTGI